MTILTPDFIKENIPMLGFGTMRFPQNGPSGKDIDIEKVKAMADHYMANGLNYFDTAFFYHDGHSENAVKEAVVKRFPRESFMLADKFPVWMAESAADVERIWNEQLERCGVDYFDFYLIHALDGKKLDKNEELGAFDYFLKKKEEGKIKSLGFSFHGSAADLRRIFETHPEMEFVQLQINYYDWEFEAREFYEIARSHNKPIIIMEPIRGGFLAKMPNEIEAIFKAANPDMSIASWAMRWVASLEGVMTVLSGMSNQEQMEDNVSYMKDFQPLTDAEQETVKQAVKTLLEAPTIPCTNCKYCIECPIEIPIFEAFDMYNGFVNDKNVSNFKREYKTIDVSKNAAACIECGFCESVCPQNIEIIDKLADIAALA